MLYLLQSKCESHNSGDIIINTDYIKRILITYIYKLNIYALRTIFINDVNDTDDFSVAVFDKEEDARECLADILSHCDPVDTSLSRRYQINNEKGAASNDGRGSPRVEELKKALRDFQEKITSVY